jgi:hypothetical protein
MPLPAFVVPLAAIVGVGALLFRNKAKIAIDDAHQLAINVQKAQAVNASANAINAANAADRAQGIIPAGAGPRNVDVSQLHSGPKGITFSKTSPMPTLFQTSNDADLAFVTGQIVAGDIITADVGLAGIHVDVIPSGNMLFEAAGPPVGGLVPLKSIDPRAPSDQILNVSVRALTDDWTASADFAKAIVGMGQTF